MASTILTLKQATECITLNQFNGSNRGGNANKNVRWLPAPGPRRRPISTQRSRGEKLAADDIKNVANIWRQSKVRTYIQLRVPPDRRPPMVRYRTAAGPRPSKCCSIISSSLLLRYILTICKTSLFGKQDCTMEDVDRGWPR